MPDSKRELTRDDKVENLIVNHTMIAMSLFEGAFTAMAAGMAEAVSKTGDALAHALGGAESSTSASRTAAGNPASGVGAGVTEKTAQVFSEIRKETVAAIPAKDPAFKKFIKDPSFDEGVRIVESHNFKLPRLTERLSDADLAGYMALIRREDKELSGMLQELAEWQKRTPQFKREHKKTGAS